MLKLNTSTQFKKDYKTCIKRHYKMDLLQAVVDVLRVPDALPQKNRDSSPAAHHRAAGLLYCFCHLDDIIIPCLVGCGKVGQSDLAKVVGDHVVQALPHRIGSAVGQPLTGGSTGHKAAHGGKAALGQQ